ncbi:MAG: N-glycosylase [Thermodesulfobacteriota bacterium]|nr:MAG: N-glycosylase [Thermodesulfobacteriota bacterium]
MASSKKVEELQALYAERKDIIKAQLNEFVQVHQNADDRRIFEELAFCILTSAVGPKVGAKSLEAIKDILLEASPEELEERLTGIHKYPEKAYYIVPTREYLKNEYGLKLSDLVNSFNDPLERREFFALNKDIKGLGLTQASHFLRNIGIKGYAILDRNVVRSLYDLRVLDNPKPPTTKKKYLEAEEKMKDFASELSIEIEELDMLLWSMKTGHIPK